MNPTPSPERPEHNPDGLPEMEEFRFLRIGETFQRGDQFWDPSTKKWQDSWNFLQKETPPLGESDFTYRRRVATRTPAPDGSKQAESDHASPPDKCPVCGSPEVEANTPRTAYACGSSDYDQRPGTFIQQCSAPEAVAGEQLLGSIDNFYEDAVEDIAHALAHELEAAELNRNDLVTVNREKLKAIARRILAKAPTPPADKDAEIKSIRHEHDCGCEVCAMTSAVCPASASTYAEEIATLRSSLLAANQRIEALEGALREIANFDNYHAGEKFFFASGVQTFATNALAHAAEVGKEQNP